MGVTVKLSWPFHLRAKVLMKAGERPLWSTLGCSSPALSWKPQRIHSPHEQACGTLPKQVQVTTEMWAPGQDLLHQRRVPTKGGQKQPLITHNLVTLAPCKISFHCVSKYLNNPCRPLEACPQQAQSGSLAATTAHSGSVLLAPGSYIFPWQTQSDMHRAPSPGLLVGVSEKTRS